VTDEPDFEALRAERNRDMKKAMEEFAEAVGATVDELHTTHDPDACYCACGSGGPCEHRWDGEGVEFDDGCGWSATCSRCGGTAMSHSMRVGP